MTDIPAAGSRFERLPASVGDDMRRIFGEAPGPSGSPPARARAIGVGGGDGGGGASVRARSRRLPIALGLLAATAGVAGGLIVAMPLRAPAASSQRPLIVARAGRAAPRAMAVALSSPIAAGAVPRREVRESAADAPFAGRAIAPRRIEAPAPRPTRPSGTAVADADCDDDAPKCLRADVLAADRDLRTAYDDAVYAGVERARLVAIRNRWARLRASDQDRPEDLLDDYAELTDRLDRATRVALDDWR